MNFVQWLISDISKNVMSDGTAAKSFADATPATYELMVAGQNPTTGKGNATLGAYIAVGSGRLERLWPELAFAHQRYASGINYFKDGHIKHHATEAGGMGQIAALINMLWNRDAQCHTHTNFEGNGLPLELQNEIFAEHFGAEFPGSADALYDGYDITPMNKAKAVYAKLSILYLELHNSMTLCNYTLPGWASPLKSRNYRGDIDLEAKFHTAVTGEAVTRQDMEKTGLRIMTIFRALTARYMENAHPGTGRDMRNNHDKVPDYAFEDHPTTLSRLDVPPGDWALAKDMLYDELGWDRATGLPTLATYTALGLSDVAAAMAAAGLMP
jgi:aldehyde:ferredoxin oxidoreductase